jgi:hypothetical protein
MKLKFWPLLAALVLFADSASVAQNFWEPANGTMPGSVERITVSQSGTLFLDSKRSDDDGNTWVQLPTFNAYDNLSFYSSPNGALFEYDEDDATFSTSSNDGNSWQQMNLQCNTFPVFDANANGFIVASNWDGISIFGNAYDSVTIFRSTDNGSTWKSAFSISTSYITSLCNFTDSIILAGTSKGELMLLSMDDSLPLKNGSLPDGDVISSIASDSNVIYVGTQDSGVFRSFDSGKSFVPINDNVADLRINKVYAHGGLLFVGTRGAGAYRSTNNGTTWIQVVSQCPKFQYYSVNDFASDQKGEIFAATDIGLFQSGSGESDWNLITRGGLCTEHGGVSSVTCASDGSVFVLGESLYRSIDNEQTWEPICADSGGWISQYAFSRGILYIWGWNGFYRSTDNGESWVAIDSGLVGVDSEWFFGPTMDQCGHLFLLTDEALYVSTDSGSSWHQSLWEVSNGGFETYVSNSNCDIFAGADGVFRSTDNGETWTLSGLANEYINYLAINSKGYIYASTETERLYRSTDNGTTWQFVSKIDSGTEGMDIILIDSHDNILAGTNSNSGHFGLLLSSDGGGTWVPDDSGFYIGNQIHSMTLSPDGSIFVATDPDGLYRSASFPLDVHYASALLPSISLSQNSPNPVTQSTTISFTLPEPSYITLTLYDATGREVAALASGYMDSGEHDVPFQRSNLPSGVYFYRLESGSSSQTRAMVILP